MEKLERIPLPQLFFMAAFLLLSAFVSFRHDPIQSTDSAVKPAVDTTAPPKRQLNRLPLHAAFYLMSVDQKLWTEHPTGSNKGGDIDLVNSRLGLNGTPWCAAVASSFTECGNVEKPVINSARALNFRRGDFRTLEQIQLRRYIPKPGDWMIYSYGHGRGHVDVCLHWNDNKQRGIFCGGNRSDQVKMIILNLAQMRQRKVIGITSVSGDGSYDIAELIEIYRSEYNITLETKYIENVIRKFENLIQGL